MVGNIRIKQLIDMLEDFREWNIGSCVITHKKTGDEYWIANGFSCFEGYGKTYFKLSILQKIRMWRHVKKMINANFSGETVRKDE